MARDTSRDGLSNKVLTYALSNLKPFWNFVQSNEPIFILVSRGGFTNLQSRGAS